MRVRERERDEQREVVKGMNRDRKMSRDRCREMRRERDGER